jgi:acetyl-CoA acetyltransferase
MLQMTLGFEDLSMLNAMNAWGATTGTMIQYAAMAIQEGLANVVVLIYADVPLKPNRGSGSSYGGLAVDQ